jgi:hypothetical protein
MNCGFRGTDWHIILDVLLQAVILMSQGQGHSLSILV